MRSIMLLVVGISLLVACSGSQASVAPNPTPDVPKFSRGQAISVVQSNLGNYGCRESRVSQMVRDVANYREWYNGGGKWTVTFTVTYANTVNRWEVFESSMTARIVSMNYC